MEAGMGWGNRFLKWFICKWGVAILLPGNMEYEIVEKYKDSDGRLIVLKCKFENTNYIISNCYAYTTIQTLSIKFYSIN